LGAGPVLTLVLLLLVGAAAPAGRDAEPTPDRARADLIAATREYRESLERVLTLKARDIDRAAALVDARRAQYARGLVARRDVEEADRRRGDRGAHPRGGPVPARRQSVASR